MPLGHEAISPAQVQSPNIERTQSAIVHPAEESDQPVTSAGRKTNLLDLPAELRIRIWTETLRASADTSLLHTCRTLYMESSSILYQRPVHFASQKKLFAWIDRSESSELTRVRFLTLRLTDVDLSSLFNTSPNSNGQRISAWDLYQRELIRLDEALEALPSLSQLILVPPDKHKSVFLKSMYMCFLRRIPVRCHKLERLIVHDDNSVLQKVPELRRLAKVVCDNSTSSQSPSTLDSMHESQSKMKREDRIVIKEESASDES
ncbi:hypothetical protein CB0940_06148 [Cercospora beticola]|uniref:Uncharacterized protein n=1 Tax=Cercospora beticola TaxID=122368 RepID=A0A2G5I0Z1_CERBT|nr:hypothetical protein CB0940_06148 [Cercospora beticola]PIA98467.1 hypothetical protein CB0940_06148 [Cercospora beticola]CAK1360039.1 unnamed protein product [Cercospora beticola]